MRFILAKVLATGEVITAFEKEDEPIDTTAMMKDMMDSQKGHFWRDQRVEIMKILLNRPELNPNATTGEIVAMADDIIQKLKSYGD